MSGKALCSCPPARACASLLVVVVCAALALSVTPASAAEPCANEPLRGESNTNPVTKQPYSRGLPECRAYEMVSPLYKQAHDAGRLRGFGFPVAPNGETVGFGSEGAFAEPENYVINFFPANAYLARRGASGWIARSAFAPHTLVDKPSFTNGIDSDFSPDLSSVQVSCGVGSPVKGEQNGVGIECAKRELGGPWVGTPLHTAPGSRAIAEEPAYLGGPSDLSRVFIEPLERFQLLPQGTSIDIYELAGVATAEEKLRLVNVDKSGNELLDNSGEIGGGPRLGDDRGQEVTGSAYHAISADGKTVFFTATPTKEQQPAGEQLTVYARVRRGEGAAETAETVAVSNPSPEECTACSLAKMPAKLATFQGASADGSKVFFTTEQQLLTSDTDGTNNLYEYDFPTATEPSRLVEVSKVPTPGAEANVLGVVRTSSDGSHVYFVAQGVLANGAQKGESNLYGYDTVTGETKFVATLGSAVAAALWGESDLAEGPGHEAQTTRDGRYLVFSFPVKLAGDTNGPGAGAVYRYDFKTGELTWISHPESAAGKEGKSASVAQVDFARTGANAMIDDWNRAISENGESIVFTTSEKLQESDTDGVEDVYLWHEGKVSMISAGGGIQPAMSASGSDIIFATSTRLVGQDTDVLGDVYDARVGGGFAKPRAEPACQLEACQEHKPPPSFGPVASSLAPAGGNLAPTVISSPPPVENKNKPLTEAQKLAKALRACKGKPKKKRAACELQARKRYGAQQFAKALKACKHKPKNRRVACERQARRRYGR
jgi:hypothetical protein